MEGREQPTGLPSGLAPNGNTTQGLAARTYALRHFTGLSKIPLIHFHLSCSSYALPSPGTSFVFPSVMANPVCQRDKRKEGEPQLRSYGPVGMTM